MTRSFGPFSRVHFCNFVGQEWYIPESDRLWPCSKGRRNTNSFLAMELHDVLCMLFPTCQVSVARFYQSFFLPPSFLLPFFLLPPSFHLPPTAKSRSQQALPDLHRELQISVGTWTASAGPQLRAPDLSKHCRTSTEDLSGHYRTSTRCGALRSGARGCGLAVPVPERMSE